MMKEGYLLKTEMSKWKIIFYALYIASVLFPMTALADKNVVIIPKDTLLIGKLITPAHSQHSRIGSTLYFSIDEGFDYDKLSIIPAGTMGIAKVLDKRKAGYFGVGGKIVFEPQSLILANGVRVPLYFPSRKNSSKENDSNNAILGVATMGIGSCFLHGSNQKFPTGTRFNILVKEDVVVGNYDEIKNFF